MELSRVKPNNIMITDPRMKNFFREDLNPGKFLEYYTRGSNVPLNWSCPTCNLHDKLKIKDRIKRKNDCLYCDHIVASQWYNLEMEYPILCKEYSKDNPLPASAFLPNSHESVKWECIKIHTWFATIYNRVNGANCGKCSGKIASDEYNLFIINPELCNEWDYIKNTRHPRGYTPKSDEIVPWICLKCKHEWDAEIKSRANGTGCPICASSKGEKFLKQYLDENNIQYKPQKKFTKELGQLSYDFEILNQKLLIEFDGEQHYKYIKHFHSKNISFKTQLERDFRKTLFCLNNGYKLLKIPYSYLNRINEILDYYFSLENPKQIYCHHKETNSINIRRVYKYHEDIRFSTDIPRYISYITNMKSCELCCKLDSDCYECQKNYVLELVAKDLDKLKIKYELKKSIDDYLFDLYLSEKNLLVDIGYRNTLIEDNPDKNLAIMKYGHKLLRINHFDAYFIKDVLNKYNNIVNVPDIYTCDLF